ncbi:FecR family protein [Croceivirga sp. JEA036]|uniref:FecR family protein n=1 Tax=Croceivirga sp. JEA036 TaxID=2721162 RepID=UPI00143CA309|nr:FecR family protein [Croceivirga sp. JEA036]NJB37295.1 FecR family protein [Croceivirga sp. JEA036]
MQENYLAKWLNNELTDEELEAFKATAEYAQYQKIKETTDKLSPPEFDIDQAWMQLNSQRTEKAPKVITLSPFKKFLRVAAVAAVLIVGSYFYLGTLNTQVTTQMAERTELTLPDNSEIILNADSKVTYNKKNWDNERNVELEGEAFFKVAKGKKFTVATDLGDVAVLGTQFNVQQRDDYFKVTCFEGLVQVSYKDQILKLPAGHSFAVVNGSITKQSTTATQPSWMQNESTFNSVPLKYVLAEFERQYDFKVETKNVDTEQLFTGTFSNSDFNVALESISTPLQLKYTVGTLNVVFYAEDTP